MDKQSILNKLKNGEATIGSWMQIPSTDVAEIMGQAGYDWIAVDLEHGRFSELCLPDIFRALELGGTVPFARVAQAEAKDIKVALDSGAKGIIYPMIESAEQLRQALSWSTYPPNGTRGVGFCRANLFGKNFDECLDNDFQNIIKVAQLEHIMSIISDKAKDYKIPMGVHVVQPDINALKDKICEGYQFIAYSIDAMFLINSSQSPMIG